MMTRTRRVLTPIAVVWIVIFGFVLSNGAYAKGQATAVELAENAEKQAALIVRAARRAQDPALAPTASEAKPFWTSLKRLNQAAIRLGNGAQLQDESFHKALGETVSATVATIAAFELSGAKDSGVETSMDRLEETLGVLQKSFSKASAREREGDGLTGKEKQQLDAIKAKSAELEKRLNAIEPKVRGNRKAVRVIREVRDRTGAIRGSGSTFGDFLAAIVTIQIVDGIIRGGNWWWGPWGGWYPDFSLTYISLHDTIIADISYDWAYYAALQADLEDAVIEDAIDDAELFAAEEYLEQEIDDALDQEANLDLDGIEDVLPEDLDNPDLGLDEADLLPEQGLPGDDADLDIGAVPDGVEQLPADIDGPATDLETQPEIAPEPMPEVGIAPEPEVLPEIVDIPEPELPDVGFDDIGGGVEDFGGGFDDLGGGFDDW